MTLKFTGHRTLWNLYRYRRIDHSVAWGYLLFLLSLRFNSKYCM